MMIPIFRGEIGRPEDVVRARQWARTVAAGLEFPPQDQTRIVAAVSEIVGNAVAHAGAGCIQFLVEASGAASDAGDDTGAGTAKAGRPGLVMVVASAGAGSGPLAAVVGWQPGMDDTGMDDARVHEIGIGGVRQLMDGFDAATGPSGTTVRMVKLLPARTCEAELRTRVRRVAARLDELGTADPVDEVCRQNGELLRSLTWLRQREEQLTARNQALEAAEAALQCSLREKDVLIREVHHRVKNNLQVISSLIGLQTARCTDGLWHALTGLSGRVRALGLIHDKLYEGPDLARINLQDYVTELCAHLDTLFDQGRGRITLVCQVCDVTLPMDDAINIGLVINELVTNAYRHAFPGPAGGEVRVTGAVDAGFLVLSVVDDGCGLDRSVAPRELRATSAPPLGIMLAESIASRLGGTLFVGEGPAGAGIRAELVVPLAKPDCSGEENREMAVAG